MTTIFSDTMRRLRGQLIAWGLGLALLTASVVPLYSTVEAQAAQIQQLAEAMPPAMLTAFDIDASTFASPRGYLNSKLFASLPLIFGLFAVIAGSALLAKDEERGTLDLQLAHPVSRSALFVGRVAAALVTLLAIALLGWATAATTGQASGFPATAWEFLLPFLSLALTLAPLMMLALLLSMVLPSHRLAAGLTGLVLVASFFLSAFAKVDERLVSVARLLPLHYYQSGHAMDGLNPAYAVGLLAATALLGAAAWWRFQRRDLRVMGEGSWRTGRPRVAQR